MINSIRLLNWRSHSDTTLEFRQGTNLLVGAMGSGKSSLMDSISFALFGTFPALDRRKLKLQDLFRMNEDKASVSLEFAWSGSQYKVERRLTKGKKRVDSEAEIFKDKKLLDSGPKAVTSFIEQLLAVDYDLFTRAIYSEQNNIDYFLTLDPRRRKQELDQLLGLDRFETARTNIVSVINRVRSNRLVLEQKFDADQFEQAKAKMEEQEKEMIQAKDRMDKLKEQAERQRASLKQSESGFSELKKKKESFESLSKEKLRQETLVSQLNSELEGIQVEEQQLSKKKTELAELQKKKEETAEQLKQIDSHLSQLSKQTGSLETKLKRIEQSEKELQAKKKQLSGLLGERTLEQLEQGRSDLEKEAISLFSEQKSLIASVSETEELLKNLKPGSSSCPLCNNQLGEAGTEKLIQEKGKKVEEQKKRIEELKSLIQGKKKMFSELSGKLKEADSIGSSIINLEKEIQEKQETEKELREISGKMKTQSETKLSIQTSIQGVEKQIHDLSLETSRLEQLLKKQVQMKEAREKLLHTSLQLKELGFDENQFEAKRKELEVSRMDLERTINESESVAKALQMLTAMMDQLKKETERMKLIGKEIADYSILEEQLAIYRNALLETQTSLRSGLTDAINAAMKEIWSIFYPYRNYPSIKLSVNEKDYLFEVLERDEWKSLESIASGGERACAALTLRVALAMVLTPNLSWLILDEPTHNLDADAITLLSETLQNKVPEVVKQTFVITHEEGLMGADFSSSYRLSRDKSGLGPTKAERI